MDEAVDLPQSRKLIELSSSEEHAMSLVPDVHEAPGHSISVPADLFPLAMTPLEQYLVLDDTPEQPMTAFVQLTFATPLDHDRLVDALATAVHRNPLMSSRILTDGKTWRWQYDPDWKPSLLSWDDDPPVVNHKIRPIDLRKEAGLRAWFHRHSLESNTTPALNKNDSAATPTLWRLLFQIHHAVADGVGMRKFALDLLICYARSCSAEISVPQKELRLDRLNHHQLINRHCIKHLTETAAARPLTAWQKVRNLHYFFLQPPQPLQGAQRAPLKNAAATSSEPVVSLQFPLDESLEITDRARTQNVSLNDLGLAILFHQCRSWHERHSVRGARKRIRLLMPVDIRTRQDLRLSAANRLSFAFLGRTHAQCENWQQLLASIQAETQWIKESRVYVDFYNGLSLCQRHPRLFQWILGRSRHMASAIFTYGGDINRGLSRIFVDQHGCKRVGDALWEDVWAAPPARSNTNVALGFCLSRDRICMSASWNREALTYDEAQRFLNEYANAWRVWYRTGELKQG